MSLPTGTVTFLRTDIEGSMELVRALGARYDAANAEHAAIVRACVVAHAGEVVRTEGDAFFVVFTDAGQAARAAVEVQRGLVTHTWPEGRALKLRMGIHTGVAVRAGDDYGGFEVSRAARVADVGHGGQIIVSESARALIAADLSEGAALIDLGSHRLKGVPEPMRLHQLVAPGLEVDFPSLRTGRDPAEHLPERLTTLVGRARELDELGALLGGTRLLTLTGPGGTGKTTLALELARLHAADYAEGAWFVDLHAMVEVDAARAQLARDLGLFDGPAGPAVDRLLPYLAERELLVVIDNLEQLPGAADLVGELVRGARASRFIATSRTSLRLAAEQEYAVRPLAIAADDGADDEPAAVRLFIERARKYRPDLHLDGADLVAVGRACRHLDGLPLAIELCAARVTVLPIDRIVDRLAQQLPLPGSGPRDLPARQRTIEETVAWSFELLDPSLRRLFTRLGVFDGSFELEQAEGVCGQDDGDVLDGLASLVEQSLLVRLEDPVGGVRFRMLEVIRAFARARLERSDEAGELRERHAQAYLALLQRLLPKHADPGDARGWLDRLEADADNVRQAVSWAIDAGRTDLALGLVGYLWRYWVHGGRIVEGRTFTRAALDLPGAGTHSEARVWSLSAAGSVAYWSNDVERASALYEEQRALAAELGLLLGEADGWYNLIFTRRASGDEAGGDAAAKNARRILTELGETSLLDELTAALLVMSLPALLADPEAQRPAMAERISALEGSESPAIVSALRDVRAAYALVSGDLGGAARHLASALRLGLTWRRHADVITGLALVSAVGVGRMDAEVPATMLGALDSAFARYGVVGPPWPQLLSGVVSGDPRTELAAILGTDQFERAFERGRHMSLDEAVTFFEERAGAAEDSLEQHPSIAPSRRPARGPDPGTL